MFRNVSFLVAHGYCTPYLLEATLLQGTEKDCAISATPSTITMHSGRQERKNHPFPQTSRLHGHILRCHRYLAVLPDSDLFQQANCKLNPKFCRLGTNLTHGKHIVQVIRVQSAGGTLGLVMVCHGLSISASLQSPSDPSDGPTWGRKVTVGMAGATEIHALRWSKQTRHVPAVPAFRFETEIL